MGDKLNFKQWLLTLNSNVDYWNKCNTFKELEKAIIECIKISGYINLKEIYDRFFCSDNPEIYIMSDQSLRFLEFTNIEGENK